MKSCAIILDPQYDYLESGPIRARNSNRVLQNLMPIMAQSDWVIVTRDVHPENHFSFKDEPTFTDGSWPPHCVKGTDGARIFPAIRKRADFILSKGLSPVPPDDYSAFKAKKLRPLMDLTDILGSIQKQVDEIIVAGFLLETGVQATAFDCNALSNANDRWSQVTVPLEACGTILNAAGVAKIIEPMIKAGINIIDYA